MGDKKGNWKGKTFNRSKKDENTLDSKINDTESDHSPIDHSLNPDSSSDKKHTGKTVKKQQEETSLKKEIAPVDQEADVIRLNKYLSKAGLCSRREADALIAAGDVSVNGEIIKELGVKVKLTDQISFKDKVLTLEKLRYVLLNKPKDSITTMDDTHDRRTVMEFVTNACEERIYPVGRLDRMTTGLLLLTNDGELAKKLTHPSHQIKKIYLAILDKPLSSEHLNMLLNGIELEDGITQFDTIEYDNSNDKTKVIVSLHSGKNRIVRRMFAGLSYRVEKLDRISFAGLSKGDLTRGKWRFLNDKEVGFLKMLK